MKKLNIIFLLVLGMVLISGCPGLFQDEDSTVIEKNLEIFLNTTDVDDIISHSTDPFTMVFGYTTTVKDSDGDILDSHGEEDREDLSHEEIRDMGVDSSLQEDLIDGIIQEIENEFGETFTVSNLQIDVNGNNADTTQVYSLFLEEDNVNIDIAITIETKWEKQNGEWLLNEFKVEFSEVITQAQ